jgi:TfoX/Sxy family transcriptional regulator of competence genes
MVSDRVRALLPEGHASEKRMFGGIAFLVNGNMLCCAFNHGLMIRIGKEAEAAALAEPFVRRPGNNRRMGGFVFVEPDGLAEPAALLRWIAMARAVVDPLPPKAAKAKRRG